MAREKRTNYAKVKIWMEDMTADVEVFRSCPTLKAMDAALAKMQAIRAKHAEREAEQCGN